MRIMRAAECDINVSVMPAIASLRFHRFNSGDHIVKYIGVVVVR